MTMVSQATPVLRALSGGTCRKPSEDSIEVEAVLDVAQWIVDDHHNTNGVGTTTYEARDNGDVFIGIKWCGGGTAPTSKIGTKWHAGRYDGLSWRADAA